MNSTRATGGNALMIIGIVLVVLGLLLLLSPAAVGTAVVKLVALVLALTGLAQLIHGLRAARSADRWASGILGVVVAGLGVLVWFNPGLGSGFLTALLMIFFIANAVWKVASALRYRTASGWAWLLLSGVISLLFVYLLWRQWPLAGAWAIGVLVGLDLLLTGIALILLARSLRALRGDDDPGTVSL